METLITRDKLIVTDKTRRIQIPRQTRMPDFKVTSKYLKEHPEVFYVFEDSFKKDDPDKIAKFRKEFNGIGFVVKKDNRNSVNSFYTMPEYYPIFEREKDKLIDLIITYKNKLFLISKIGCRIKYCLFDKLIEPWLLSLQQYNNVLLLF